MPPAADSANAPLVAEPDRSGELRERLLEQLYLMGRSTMSAAPVTGLITWALFYWLTGRSAVLVWAALLHGTQAWRWMVIHRNVRAFEARPPGVGPPNDPTLYVLLLAASALAWGAASWLLLPAAGEASGRTLSPSEMAAMLAVMAFGMMAGSVPGVSPWRTAVLAWLPPAAMILAAGFAWHGGLVGWILAGCSLLFGGSMVSFALVQHRLLADGLRSQIEKEVLSDRLLLQSRDLERLNQERSRFFASASHDLRQPVHALALFSSALHRDLHDHPAQPVAERVVEATRQVSELLNAMLDISKIDAGAVRPVFAELSLDHVFLRLNQIYEERAVEAGLSLRFHLVPGPVLTDGELLFRILSNFVDNALKYCERGGVLVSARRRGAGIRLAVWDTGRGIREQHVPLLFDEFYQVDNAHRDITQGLGIGLAIVKRLAALLGGKLGLRSVPGQGSVFWIDLPDRPAIESLGTVPVAEVLRALPPAVANRGARPHVLLLDDEIAVCEAMRIWLQPHCGAIHVAQTVEAALAIVEREGPLLDALIVDFRLAGSQNGIEATRLLRAVAGRELPAILVTGDTDPARVRAAYDSGLVVMFKPVQPEQLVSALQGL